MSAERMRRFQRVHFIGIGGAGMCGIAEVMLNLGYTVTGSDRARSAVVERLGRLGAEVQEGHEPALVRSADVVVVSSAIREDNPEVVAAREGRKPVVPRAEMLGELMRFREGIAVAGTHGKTTTTSLTASLLAEGGLDPTFVIGGLLKASGTNARLGAGQYLVAEADESDGSFLLLQPMTAVVTNIDRDHLETYGHDYERLLQAFEEFLHHLPFYGLAVVCGDDPGVRAVLPRLTRDVVTYGLSPENDLYAENVRQDGLEMTFDVRRKDDGQRLRVRLALPGEHNVCNALAAIAVAHDAGVDDAAIVRALGQFGGIGRRFNVHDDVVLDDRRLRVMDDYAHHPTELAATIAAARAAWPDQRLIGVFQPHRYTRTHELFDDFATVLNALDGLVLLEVYAAGEEPLPGADARSLARAIRARGRLDPVFAPTPDDALELLPDIVANHDVLMFLGAGNVGAMAGEFVDRCRPEAVS
ncbi:MAG: UDP-N-acetylmuramate--L-alanine ligase [Pseudomonadota bacterium]